MQQELNLTVAYVTHDQEEALAVSDSIIVMNNGNIAQVGSPIELYEQPSDLFVANFIGEANVVEAQIVEERGDRAAVRAGAIELDLPRREAKQGPVKLAIRPEAVGVHLAKPDIPSLTGRVVKESFLGNHLEYMIETPLGVLMVVDRSRSRPPAHQGEVWITFDMRGVIVIPHPG